MTALLLLLGGLCTMASATGIPDLSHSRAWTVYDGPGTPCVFSVPDGSGMAFTEAVLPDETVVDATIVLEVIDGNDLPVAFFPREDLWIGPDNGQWGACPGGTLADEDTDLTGRTTWSRPLFVSGWADEGVYVYINGDVVTSGLIPVVYRSSDLDLSGVVNLTDLGHLAIQIGGPGNGSGDLNNDGRVNLTDVCFMMETLNNRSCP